MNSFQVFRSIGFSIFVAGALVGCGERASNSEMKLINGIVYDDAFDRDGVNLATVRIWVKAGKKLTSCTATRISERSFMTAAHCFYTDSTIDGIYIKGGFASTYDSIKDNFTLDTYTIHPEHVYERPQTFDIALFRVGSSDVSKLSKIRTATVEFDSAARYESASIWGYGCAAWGGSQDGHKRYGNTVLSDSSALGAAFKYVNLTSADLDSTAPALCPGDSGGPLVQDRRVVGVNTGYKSPYSYYARLDLSNVKIWYADFVDND